MTTYKPEPWADPEQGAKPASTFTPNYALATIQHTPVAGTIAPADTTTMYSQMKQGSKCCGCCCDYRRAIIILNTLFIISGVLSVSLNIIGTQQIGQFDLDDDALKDTVEDIYRQEAILAGVGGVFASVVAVVGACRYDIYKVGFNIIYMIANFIATILLTNKAYNALEEDYNGGKDIRLPIGTFVVQGVGLCVLIYPHVGFMFEVKAGIMSAETYPEKNFRAAASSGDVRKHWSITTTFHHLLCEVETDGG
jgi:hypothetical protein